MIAWNAFFTYILKPTTNIKVIVVTILLTAIFVRRNRRVDEVYRHLQKLPITYCLLIVLTGAFLMRLAWMLWSPHIPPAPITEELIILEHARDLAAGEGFKTRLGEWSALRPIGYPLFLAGIFKLVGENLFIPKMINVLSGTLSVFLLFQIGKQIHSNLLGLFASFAYAFYPTAIMSVSLLMDEHLFIPLWLLGIVILISDLESPAWRKFTLASIVLAVSAVIRTYSVIMVPVVFMVWLIKKEDLRKAASRCFLLAFLMFLFALPWAVRNQLRLGKPVFYTTLLGIHLYYANNPTSDVRYPVNPSREQGGDEAFLNTASEVERDLAGRKAAFQWIVKNPAIFVQKALGRSFYMLGLNREGWVIDDNFTHIRENRKPPSRRFLKFLGKFEQYYYVVVFWFGIIGILFVVAHWLQFHHSEAEIYVVTILFFYLLVTAIFLNHRKYRFSIEPFFCVLAAHCLLEAFFGRFEKFK